MPTSPLTPFFAPKSVAVIGATEKPEHVGRTILWNLLSSPFGGTVFPVNPTRPSVLGIKAYPNLAAIPDPIELAVIVTPAPTVPGLIRECAQARIPAAVIISAGFRESGPRGAALEAEVLAEARQAGQGGKVSLTAQLTANGVASTITATVYVQGAQIPPSTVTPQLKAALAGYTGPISNILTGIAWKESQYTVGRGQFANIYGAALKPLVLYGQQGLWPQENGSGNHVGLLQVFTNSYVAWNWMSNISTGAQTYLDACNIEPTYENTKISACQSIGRTLMPLSASQRQQNAVLFYRWGSFAWKSDKVRKGGIAYWVPSADCQRWIILPNPPTDTTDYVEQVLKNVQN